MNKSILKKLSGLERQIFINNMGKSIFFELSLGGMLSYEILVEDDDGIFYYPIFFGKDDNGNWIITDF